jgi:hypothetical protein
MRMRLKLVDRGINRDQSTCRQMQAGVTNHHQLLDNVLRPMHSGEAITLVAAERCVLRYLLLERSSRLAVSTNFSGRRRRATHHETRSSIDEAMATALVSSGRCVFTRR